MGIRDAVARAVGGGFFLPAPATNGTAVAKAEPAPAEAKSVIIQPEVFWVDGMVDRVLGAGAPSISRYTAFLSASLAFLCIQKRYQKLAEAPPMVVEETDEGDEWLDVHPLNPLLAKPNADYLFRRLYQLTSVYRDITDRSLWVKDRTRGKQVGALRVFSGDEFTVEPDLERGLEFGRFHVSALARNRTFGPEDVVFFPGINPYDPRGGVSRLDAALTALNIDASLQVSVRSALKNSLMPGAAISIPSLLSDPDFNRLKGQMNQQHGGALNTGLPFLMPGGAVWNSVAPMLDKLIPPEVIALVESRVCAVFELHPSMLGIKTGIENSPWSNLQQAQRMLYDEMCIPRWAADAEILTESLLREVDPDPSHVIRFDTSQIPVLREDMKEKADIVSKVGPYLEQDEVRVFLGFEARGGELGKARFVPANWMPAELMAAGGIEPEPRTSTDDETDDDPTPEPEE